MFFEPGFLSPSFIILLAGIAGLRAFVPDRLLLRYGVLAAILLLALSFESGFKETILNSKRSSRAKL